MGSWVLYFGVLIIRILLFRVRTILGSPIFETPKKNPLRRNPYLHLSRIHPGAAAGAVVPVPVGCLEQTSIKRGLGY